MLRLIKNNMHPEEVIQVAMKFEQSEFDQASDQVRYTTVLFATTEYTNAALDILRGEISREAWASPSRKRKACSFLTAAT